MKITDALLKEIYAHASEAYPAECVGFLLGMPIPDEGGWVRQVVRATNLNTDRTDRFEIDPKEFLDADRLAEEDGQEIIGLYHSHPDWPAIPSQTDIASEVEGFCYLIVSVGQGRPLNTRAWQIAPPPHDTPRRFVEDALEIVDEQAL